MAFWEISCPARIVSLACLECLGNFVGTFGVYLLRLHPAVRSLDGSEGVLAVLGVVRTYSLCTSPLMHSLLVQAMQVSVPWCR